MIVADRAEVVNFLSTSEAHDTAAEILRIDTRGSIVFLAGASAIKLKRAAYIDYMDYSTVAASSSIPSVHGRESVARSSGSASCVRTVIRLSLLGRFTIWRRASEPASGSKSCRPS